MQNRNLSGFTLGFHTRFSLVFFPGNLFVVLQNRLCSDAMDVLIVIFALRESAGRQ